MRCCLWFALTLIATVLLLPRDAVADEHQAWKTNSAMWRVQDSCVTQAQKTYPDYTPESNAKREKARAACMRGSNLPADSKSLPPQTPMPGTPQQ